MRRTALLIAIPVVLAAYSVLSRPAPQVIEIVAQQESVVDDAQSEDVSNDELKVYISVYSAMQQDHSLTVEDALKVHNITLEEFRNIERRVQHKQRLVERVRTALVEQAKRRSAFSDPLPPFNPDSSKTTKETVDKNPKKEP
jgi:hypothetical protein